jgi:hypothetical protein
LLVGERLDREHEIDGLWSKWARISMK